MIVKEKQYLIAGSIAEAIAMATSAKGRFKYLAGGTDVMANKFLETSNYDCLIDISKINDLKKIDEDDNYLRIGSLVTLKELVDNQLIKSEFPALSEAAHSVGSPLIRQVATLGGNLLCENRCVFYNQAQWWRESIGFCLRNDGETCIATGGRKHCYSELVSDTAPALISMQGQIVIADVDGRQTRKIENIYTGDGLHPINMSETSIIEEILLPRNRKFRTVFKKLRLRKSLDFTSLTTSVCIDRENNLKIAIGGVDPKVVVVESKHDEEKPRLLRLALKGSRAVDNEMFSRNYRRKMLENFLFSSFEELKI